MAAEQSGTSEQEAEYDLLGGLGEALATVPVNLGDALDNISDPLGLSILDDTHSQDLAAASQEVSTDTFGVMVSRFDGKAGAFAYLLFILLYFPCVAALGAMVREVGRGWATIGALWSTGLAYVVAVTFYQTATFSQHPTSSIFWIVFSVALLGVSIYMLMRYGSKTSKTSIPITTISNCRHCE